jgi:hypothetical protein
MRLQDKLICASVLLIAAGGFAVLVGVAVLVWPTIQEMWLAATLFGKIMILGVWFVCGGVLLLAGVIGPTHRVKPPLPPSPDKFTGE